MKTAPPLDTLILTLRQQKVILDADLATLYGVPTKRLIEQVKRNAGRFPPDFMFSLTASELNNLRSQFATSRLDGVAKELAAPNRSRLANRSHGGRRTLPRAFTEHGAIMAATLLNRPEAVAMRLYVVRAFLQMREQIAANTEVLKRLAEIDKTLFKHDKSLQIIWRELQPLLNPPPAPPKRRIGFNNS